MNNRIIDVVKKFLLDQNIFVDQNLLMKYFAAVPSFPSIFALVQTLKQFGIVLSAVSSDWDALMQCNEKVLLYFKKENDTLAILEYCTDNEIEYSDGTQVYKETKESFQKKWNGILLYVEDIDEEIQSALQKSRKGNVLKKSVLSVSLLILMACLAVLGIKGNNHLIFIVSGLILKTIGAIASCFLMRHSLGLTSDFENRVCFISKLTDCNAVLSSSASKILNKISMSDIGIVYFLGGLIILMLALVAPYSDNMVFFLILLSFCSIPYSLFSIGYQTLVVKKYCPFCLIVVAVLLSESIVGFIFLNKINFEYTGIVWGLCFLIFIVCSVVFSLAKDEIRKIKRFGNLEFEYLKFKRNMDVFECLLKQQVVLEETEAEAIIVGDEDASMVITVILGLYCNLCADTYRRIKHLLISSSADFQFHFHFVSSEVKDRAFVYLYSIYKEKGAETFIEALGDWYKSHDYDRMIQKYTLEAVIPENYLIIYTQQHVHFEYLNKVDRTPVTFINKKLLPGLYKIDDLTYFVG